MAQRLQEEWLDGKFLIAMPNMADGRFAHSVIYVCAHSSEGAMGLVLNHPTHSFRSRRITLKHIETLENPSIFSIA